LTFSCAVAMAVEPASDRVVADWPIAWSPAVEP
jgi:hypothetical protein